MKFQGGHSTPPLRVYLDSTLVRGANVSEMYRLSTFCLRFDWLKQCYSISGVLTRER